MSISKTLYSEISEEKTKQLELVPLASVSNEYVKSFISRRVPVQKKPDDAQQRDYFLLDVMKKPADSTKRLKFRSKSGTRRKKQLSSTERRILRCHTDLEEKCITYEAYMPLHRLWTEYFQRAVDLEYAKKADRRRYAQLYSQLLKADYHGCMLTVTKSKCSSYVGTSGIVLKETRNVFKMVTKDNRIKTIPKENNVFTFVVADVVCTLYGRQFCIRASERAVRKFKTRATLGL